MSRMIPATTHSDPASRRGSLARRVSKAASKIGRSDFSLTGSADLSDSGVVRLGCFSSSAQEDSSSGSLLESILRSTNLPVGFLASMTVAGFIRGEPISGLRYADEDDFADDGAALAATTASASGGPATEDPQGAASGEPLGSSATGTDMHLQQQGGYGAVDSPAVGCLGGVGTAQLEKSASDPLNSNNNANNSNNNVNNNNNANNSNTNNSNAGHGVGGNSNNFAFNAAGSLQQSKQATHLGHSNASSGGNNTITNNLSKTNNSNDANLNNNSGNNNNNNGQRTGTTLKEAKDLHSPGSTVSYLSSPSSDSVGAASLVRIVLKADGQGRFGFNVKGGLDQNNSAIVVSRVAPNTPADQAAPRLREGDEVVAINGREVRGLTHDQVVKLIRASWLDDVSCSQGQPAGGTSPAGGCLQTASATPGGQLGPGDAGPMGGSAERPHRKKDKRRSQQPGHATMPPLHAQQTQQQVQGELVLLVRPQAFVLRRGGADTDPESEPDFQYIPLSSDDLESPRIAGMASAPLRESMLLLKEGLHSGALVAQFDQLYRKKPGMACDVSKLAVNAHRNRYKDISPYDKTRVILATDSVNSNDYINASYVIMKVPSSGIVNRYIATQGPLFSTASDFWQMVWEQQSTLVVMLTTLVEKARSKCYQYWPCFYETRTYGQLQVSCVAGEETGSFAFREFSLVRSDGASEERHISHMQYLAWPDHGVPDDATDFLEFIGRVRSARDAMVEPTIVHCSAGIGRTGVLILMETAMCLIEANEPVYPLEITRTMRDQRAMLIQTASQYKFVCEAILKVYREGIVKPLPEYQR
ncbi:tyrosine-protein phosphatase non-receptor type 4-like [Tropilaelaps mercedesae]|uniref:Tyrosine-protein phosphatase non-receptor type 4-like n=1 Tax=Tropilaelaps mercedesae TaxID=418985 RepID=A0A1V9XM29_9ACAR|nr:tyrosine-protein phosphatase non-receptor type 4-like [Tropilaelaps mercedesae]